MVLIEARNGPFCIDSLETTWAEFEAAIGTAVPAGRAPVFCPDSLGDGFSSAQGELVPAEPVWLTYCEAASYCAVAGKRLCGALGGGPVPYGPDQLDPGYDASVSEWYHACTAGGTQAYPYADAFEAGACGAIEIRPVGSEPGCEGGFSGVFDLVGNALEWENSCFSSSDGRPTEVTTACRARGDGVSLGYTPSNYERGCGFNDTLLFDAHLPAGFRVAAARCCADPAR